MKKSILSFYNSFRFGRLVKRLTSLSIILKLSIFFSNQLNCFTKSWWVNYLNKVTFLVMKLSFYQNLKFVYHQIINLSINNQLIIKQNC